jgi:hypothetical protein
MSRSGYDDGDGEQWDLIRWRGQVASAMRGKRGQQFFRDLVAALDAMPEKKLITDELECKDGVCALGALGRARGMDMSKLDPDDTWTVGEAFDIAHQLAAEVVYMNDEAGWRYIGTETPEVRWQRMRDWAASKIKETK